MMFSFSVDVFCKKNQLKFSPKKTTTKTTRRKQTTNNNKINESMIWFWFSFFYFGCFFICAKKTKQNKWNSFKQNNNNIGCFSSSWTFTIIKKATRFMCFFSLILPFSACVFLLHWLSHFTSHYNCCCCCCFRQTKILMLLSIYECLFEYVCFHHTHFNHPHLITIIIIIIADAFGWFRSAFIIWKTRKKRRKKAKWIGPVDKMLKAQLNFSIHFRFHFDFNVIFFFFFNFVRSAAATKKKNYQKWIAMFVVSLSLSLSLSLFVFFSQWRCMYIIAMLKWWI